MKSRSLTLAPQKKTTLVEIDKQTVPSRAMSSSPDTEPESEGGRPFLHAGILKASAKVCYKGVFFFCLVDGFVLVIFLSCLPKIMSDSSGWAGPCFSYGFHCFMQWVERDRGPGRVRRLLQSSAYEDLDAR